MIAGLAALLCGCKAHYPVAQESGKEDMAYLLFTSSGEYAGKEVTVTLDGWKPFEAKVVKSRNANRKGTSYAVPVGRKHLRVTYGGKSLYGKEIFLSTQETQIITLP